MSSLYLRMEGQARGLEIPLESKYQILRLVCLDS